MTNSALFGEPPANKHDANIMIGLFGSTKPPHKIPITEPGSQSAQLAIGLGFAIGITFFVTVGRLMTRAFRKGQVFGADDWVIIPAVIIEIAYFSNILARVPNACAGKHLDYCTYAELGLFFELGGIGQVMFFAASTLIKISMTLFNRRLTGLTSHRWQIVHYSFLALLVVWFFVSLFINIFQCQPVTAFFNFSLKVDTPSYHCLDSNVINYSFIIINAITDFCLLCVPVVIIAKVRMDYARKFRLISIFLIGAISCICSTLRIIFIHRSSKDFTYKFPQSVSLTIVDLFFGSLVASLPALNAFAEVAWSRGKSYYYGSRGASANSRSRSVGLGGPSSDRSGGGLSSKKSGATGGSTTLASNDWDEDTKPGLREGAADIEMGGLDGHGPAIERSGSCGTGASSRNGVAKAGKPGVLVSSAETAESFFTDHSEEDDRIGTAVPHGNASTMGAGAGVKPLGSHHVGR